MEGSCERREVLKSSQVAEEILKRLRAVGGLRPSLLALREPLQHLVPIDIAEQRGVKVGRLGGRRRRSSRRGGAGEIAGDAGTDA